MAALEMSTICRLPGEVSFLVNEGITEKQVEQLIQFANTDPEVKKFTSDPKRFHDREAFDKWSSKGRTIYTLEDDQENLCGILWFSKKDLPLSERQLSPREFTEELDPKDYTITFGIRTYGQARGKRLAFPFMREIFDHFLLSEGYKNFGAGGIWLETSISNKPALAVYERFGFKQVTDPDEEGRILMTLPPGVLT